MLIGLRFGLAIYGCGWCFGFWFDLDLSVSSLGLGFGGFLVYTCAFWVLNSGVRGGVCWVLMWV